MISPTVFERYEIKYLLDREQKAAVLDAMKGRVEPDRFGRSTVRSVYYDTDSFRLARRSLEKPVYKEKLRVRSYRTAKPEDEVYVELKKKYQSVVYKRRTAIREKDVADYLSGRILAPNPCQITEEIDYFCRFYETLAPRVFLSYEREAFFGTEDTGFRVTFDGNILWRTTDLSLEAGIYGENILKPGQTLMEIKTPRGIPLWMVDVLTGEGLQRTSFSKYGNAYTMMFMREKGVEEAYA